MPIVRNCCVDVGSGPWEAGNSFALPGSAVPEGAVRSQSNEFTDVAGRHHPDRGSAHHLADVASILVGIVHQDTDNLVRRVVEQ
jgi:hypothetical protein